MGKEYEARHIFLAIGLGLLVIFPILLTFLPQVIALILYETNMTWIVLLPKGTIWVYSIACMSLAMSPLILAILDVKKHSIILSIVFLLACIPLFKFATDAYEILSDEGITYKKAFAFEEKHYHWTDVDEAIRHTGNNEDEYYGYEIIFKDGTDFWLEDNNRFTAVRSLVLNALKKAKVEIDFR